MSTITQAKPKNRVRELREKAGLSRAELAEQSGVHYNNLCLYENGKRTLMPETAVKIALALNTEVLYLMGLKNFP